MAYQSNESGRPEIYMRAFVPPGAAGTAAGAEGQWQVSTAGGIHPAWRPDGKELYYLNPAAAMMAAPIAVTGATLEPGAPMMLFPDADRQRRHGPQTGVGSTTSPPTGASSSTRGWTAPTRRSRC